ncbi:MAG: helix-turn-helix domain-containing protein [Candidatus Kapaibacterium sp.]
MELLYGYNRILCVNIYGYTRMDTRQNWLTIRQLDKRYQKIWSTPGLFKTNGWVRKLRLALNMSYRQLGEKLGINPGSAQELENRELEGTISIKSLQQAANAFDMELLYVFVPKKEKTLEGLIKNRAHEIAKQIVNRARTTMALEDQTTVEEIEDLAVRLKNELPRNLWD